jgi:hypothetical protein
VLHVAVICHLNREKAVNGVIATIAAGTRPGGRGLAQNQPKRES